LRFEHRDPARVKPKGEPAVEQGAPHFSSPDEGDLAGDITQSGARFEDGFRHGVSLFLRPSSIPSAEFGGGG
jgi:hypothetical protein